MSQSDIPLPTPAAIRAAIEALVQEYESRGVARNQIADGHCYNFADDVLDRLLPSNWRHLEGSAAWSSLATECFYVPGEDGLVDPFDATEWDYDLLERWNIQVPVSERDRYNAIIDHGPMHGWIYFEGRHYDAENPEGVASFFDLAFFKRYLEDVTVSAD